MVIKLHGWPTTCQGARQAAPIAIYFHVPALVDYKLPLYYCENPAANPSAAVCSPSTIPAAFITYICNTNTGKICYAPDSVKIARDESGGLRLNTVPAAPRQVTRDELRNQQETITEHVAQAVNASRKTSTDITAKDATPIRNRRYLNQRAP